MNPDKENWFGSRLTPDEYLLLELKKIDPAHRAGEVDLFKTKWFDYRHKSSAWATYLYAACYVNAYRDCYAQTRDITDAEEFEPFNVTDIFQSRELTAVWLARQAADSIGVKYDFLLRFSMTRFAMRGWRHFPRPNALYSEELIADVKDAWQVENDANLHRPEHPQFLNENYAGNEMQDSWHSWAVKQLRRRANPHLGLAHLVYKQKLIPEALAEAEFGSGVMDRARKYALS